MAILKVAQMGHPVLRQIAEPLGLDEISQEAFQHFCDDLLATMFEYGGVGLAAPQVHVPLRVVVLELSEERGPEYLINPVIEVLSEGTAFTWEGCLSVEGIRGRVERPDHVRVTALDRDGSSKVLELEGFPAVVVQHECDHLDGVLFVDRADPVSLAFLPEFKRYGPLVGEEDDFYEDENEDDVDVERGSPEKEGNR